MGLAALVSLTADLAWLHLAMVEGRVAAACVAHLLSSALLAGWVVASGKTGMDTRAAWLLVILVLFTGPAGSAGMLYLTALTPLMTPERRSEQEWEELLFPEPRHDPVEDADEAMALVVGELRRGARPVPFLDTMRAGSTREKRLVLSLIIHDPRPGFMPALRLALQDENAAVRVQAAATIARIEARLASRLSQLQAAPGEPPPHHEDRAVLAAELLNQARLGLADEFRVRQMLSDAAAHFAAAAAGGPLSPKMQSAHGRVLSRLGRHEEALLCVTSARRQHPGDPELREAAMDLLFAAGRFSDLAALAALEPGRAGAATSP
ncbi:MAG: hypothetical protein U1F77_02545 [Kiritimatiellia bacterium]